MHLALALIVVTVACKRDHDDELEALIASQAAQLPGLQIGEAVAVPISSR